MESPFSAPVRPDYSALQRYGKTNAAIPVAKQSESALSWTQPHNRDRSTAISATLIAPQLMCWKNGVLSKFVFGAE
jgi:hypothetical protein